jgi:hypothetical protein
LELADGGELFDRIIPDKGVSPDVAHFYFRQLFNAVVSDPLTACILQPAVLSSSKARPLTALLPPSLLSCPALRYLLLWNRSSAIQRA